jgi:murein DD-endopeptidase MepM/ murein hydrolase activator NlpD
MTVNGFIEAVSEQCTRWFHKRNIIIVSERKVKHIPISGPLQFVGLVLALSGVCWASYSTGSFMAARHALKEQGQALRSVTNAKVETNFTSVYQGAPEQMTADVGPYKHSENSTAINGPVAALSGMDNAKLIARITLLESKVVELKNTNEAIVQRVHDKTAGKIDDLENIIKQTGLNLGDMKKEMSDNKAYKAKHAREDAPAEGGPYIPEEPIGFSPQAKEMFSNLDELRLLSQIIGTIPLAMPIKQATEQSTFGHRVDPFNGHLAFHSGLDLSGPIGSKIYSTANGKVVSAGRNGGYGNAIDIDHGFGIVTRYGHLSEILVEEGQDIKKGDIIGVQGSTGRSTGPHLHYEVRYHDQAINPKNFLEAGHNVSQE